jgi:hypothetical protein
VVKGGVIAFHDSDMEAVRRAIQKVKRLGQLKHWKVVNRLTYAIKI